MSSLRTLLTDLVKAYPAIAVNVEAMAALDEDVERLSFVPFFEPATFTVVTGKKRNVLNGTRQIIGVGCDELTSWTRPTSFGLRCRLRVLEAPIVRHLRANESLPAMAMLRSHLEAAALAAHCLEKLIAAAHNDSVEELKEPIHKTLFGTALKRHRERVSVAEPMKAFEGDTVQICGAIDSLDRFYYGREHAEGKVAVAYSLLCEFAHPNHRGVMDFMTASERPGGWMIAYELNKRRAPRLIVGGVETLLVSMRGGYSATELLRSWEFTEDAGRIIWQPPPAAQTKKVWEELLQRAGRE